MDYKTYILYIELYILSTLIKEMKIEGMWFGKMTMQNLCVSLTYDKYH